MYIYTCTHKRHRASLALISVSLHERIFEKLFWFCFFACVSSFLFVFFCFKVSMMKNYNLIKCLFLYVFTNKMFAKVNCKSHRLVKSW
jgi:hypothetical protein